AGCGLEVLPLLSMENAEHLLLADAKLLRKLCHRDAVILVASQGTPSVPAADRQDLLVGQNRHAVQFSCGRRHSHRWCSLWVADQWCGAGLQKVSTPRPREVSESDGTCGGGHVGVASDVYRSRGCESRSWGCSLMGHNWPGFCGCPSMGH